MSQLRSREISILFDVAGCPNRCRHCWLGNPPNQHISTDTLRRVGEQFRQWVRPGEEKPFIERLGVFTWYREPDFAPNYRELWALEQALSDPGMARRFELLSVWRLARDASYAGWAREVGTKACQLTFFGLNENTDWFTRRRGAFQDQLLATERLLEAGIRPRWQIFLTTRLLPELAAFVELIESLKLEERVRELGATPFEVFLNLPSPDGEAFHIEHLRPTANAFSLLPDYLVQKTLEHFQASSLENRAGEFNRAVELHCLGKEERAWLPELLQETRPFATWPETLALMITPRLDVYSNIGEPTPWWRLGNLGTESIDAVMRRFERAVNGTAAVNDTADECSGLYAHFHVPVAELAQTYGRPDGRQLYSRSDLIARWVRQWSQAH